MTFYVPLLLWSRPRSGSHSSDVVSCNSATSTMARQKLWPGTLAMVGLFEECSTRKKSGRYWNLEPLIVPCGSLFVHTWLELNWNKFIPLKQTGGRWLIHRFIKVGSSKQNNSRCWGGEMWFDLTNVTGAPLVGNFTMLSVEMHIYQEVCQCPWRTLFN